MKRVYDLLCFYTGVDRRHAAVRVLCFGESAHSPSGSLGLAIGEQPRFFHGIWLRELYVGIAWFNSTVPIDHLIIHELTHAFLDVLTDGFPFPRAINEGYAQVMTYFVQVAPSGSKTLAPVASAQSSDAMLEKDFMSIKDLIFFDAKKHWRRHDSAFSRMTNCGWWLVTYLAKLGRRRPMLRMVLRELRKRDIRTPDDVWKWLLMESTMTGPELEKGFRMFCTKGNEGMKTNLYA